MASRFTTRVEIVGGGTPDEYTRLHAEMLQRNFVRTIVSDSGVKYELPQAEYNFEGDTTRQNILELSKAAVSSIGKTARILISESVARTWDNLKIVQ